MTKITDGKAIYPTKIALYDERNLYLTEGKFPHEKFAYSGSTVNIALKAEV